MDLGRGSGLGQKKETKIPVCVSVTASADAAGPEDAEDAARALKQDRALVWHMCNKTWKQRKFGNREHRRGKVRKLPVSVGQELTTGGWVSLEMQRVPAAITAPST